MDMIKPFLAYRSFLMPLSTMEKFHAAGYTSLCLFPAHTFNSLGTPYSSYAPIWKWYDRLDFAPWDQMIRDSSGVMPDADILCMIDLNSPLWLEHNKMRECCDSFNNLGKAVHTPAWREAVTDFLNGFLQYTHHRYGSRIKAYILACGSTDEWYDNSEGTDDSHRREAWRKWCCDRGLPDPVDIPPESVRKHITHENFLRDPVSDAAALDYWKFCNESIADAIIYFASIAGKIIGGDAQIGCFYGYILEKRNNLISCGHLDYERVLDCPYIDFLISPGTYADRRIGGGSGFLIPHGSATVRGKKLLHECDQRTHTYNSHLTTDICLKSNAAWQDECSTVAGLKREAALGLINRTHLWWFDMWGDFYQGEAVMDTMKRIREIWDEYAASPAESCCQIALIVDPESTFYLNQEHPDIPEIHLGTRNKLSRCGAPFEVYSFRDIPEIRNFSNYKLIIFASLFQLTSEKKRILEQYVFKDDRTVLFLGPAGIIDQGKYDHANCRKLTGCPPDAEGIATAQMKGFKSVFIRNYKEVTPAVLRKIAASAGVLLYTDREWPVYAEKKLFAIHTAEGGKEKIRIPYRHAEIRELFTGKKFTAADGCFEYTFQKPDTALFVLEKTSCGTEIS